MPRLSITLRLSLLFALLSSAVLAGTGVYLYGSLERQLAEQDTEELMGKVDLLRHMLSGMRTRPEVVASEWRFRDAFVGHARLHVILLDRDGTTLFANTRLRFPQDRSADAVPASMPDSVTVWEAPWKTSYRTLSAWADLAGDRRSLRIALALDTTEQQELLAAYRRTLLLVLLLASVAAALSGFVIVRRGLRPLHDMARTAYQISADRLGERLEEVHVPPELRRFAAAFNAMLARLEDSFNRLAAFSSDLAHELRTPISNLLGQTQVALTRTRTVDDYRRVLESNLEEFDSLSRMIADMLFLARADHELVTLRTATLNLRAELDKLASFYEAHAQERSVRIVCAGEGRINADRPLVQRAVGNLLSNAIRHTPPNGEVRLRAARVDHGAVTVSVSNPGHGIPSEHLGRIFDRFYRIDGARGSVQEGAGLGLAIVRSIMVLHGGRVSVESVPDGITTFTLHFPAAVADNGCGPDEDVQHRATTDGLLIAWPHRKSDRAADNPGGNYGPLARRTARQ